MELFLKIVGGFTLGIVALVGIVILTFVLKFWHRWKSLKADLLSVTPSKVNLSIQTDVGWLREGNAVRDLEELTALGFEKGQIYAIDEMPGVELIALYHADTGASGCYYDHATAGNWLDLCATLSDGLELTVSNAPQGSELDSRPDTRKIMLAGKSPTELLAVLKKALAGKTVKSASLEGFKAEFETAYAKDMAWRDAKGGVSNEEFARVASKLDAALTGEQLRDAFKETKLSEIRSWSDDAIAEFAKSTTLSVAQWQEFEGRMCIFHADLHPLAYLDYIDQFIAHEVDDVTKVFESLDTEVELADLLVQISDRTGHQFTKLGEISHPQPFAIYGITAPVAASV